MDDQGMTPPEGHQHTPDEERRIRDAALDETLAETFPASDPLSSNPNPDDDTVLDTPDIGDQRDGRQAMACGAGDIPCGDAVGAFSPADQLRIAWTTATTTGPQIVSRTLPMAYGTA